MPAPVDVGRRVFSSLPTTANTHIHAPPPAESVGMQDEEGWLQWTAIGGRGERVKGAGLAVGGDGGREHAAEVRRGREQKPGKRLGSPAFPLRPSTHSGVALPGLKHVRGRQYRRRHQNLHRQGLGPGDANFCRFVFSHLAPGPTAAEVGPRYSARHRTTRPPPTIPPPSKAHDTASMPLTAASWQQRGWK